MSNTPRTGTFVQRRRTSPQAKWLLNEVAALRGELEKVRKHQAELAKREADLTRTIAALEFVVAPLPVPAGVNPPVTINGHLWGGRGRLNALLLECLREAHPKAVDSVALTDWIAARQNIQQIFPHERKALRRLITRRLGHLADDGQVERVGHIGNPVNGAAVWRLAGKKGPTLEELQRQMKEIAARTAEDGSETIGGI